MSSQAGNLFWRLDVSNQQDPLQDALRAAPLLHLLHLNHLWSNNGCKDEDEGRNILKGMLGIGVRAGRDVTFIVESH
jgi:hypothetical protein